MSRVLLFLIFSLVALVGSINGLTPCTAPNWKNRMESSESQRRIMGRIGLECETEGYTGGSGSGSVSDASAVFGLFVLLFIIFGVAVGIWCVCVQRQKAINAANINNFPGHQVVGAQVAHETDLKTVQKGDAGYKV